MIRALRQNLIGIIMRHAFLCLLLGALSFCSSLVRAEPTSLTSLRGEWLQVDSNAGHCADCRIVIEESGSDFTVKANNGWSAVVRQSFEGKPYVAGKGSWRPNIRGFYGGKQFYLNLGMKDDQLLMLMTVPRPDGRTNNIKSIFRRHEASDGKQT
ncbi:hypothetical protein [Rhodopseudomonas palustris]|uniref:hypothetical protein n=1 Tax=Rhodopseudomonas palustris TaxID=1076 RepID=UPI001F1945EA|nr:hypothetical protein [Rhodopseudomonas palustris]